MNQHLMTMPSILDTLDYSSLHHITQLLNHYNEIEAVAMKGYPAVMELYVELDLAISKMPNKAQLLVDIEQGNHSELEQHAIHLSKILEGRG